MGILQTCLQKEIGVDVENGFKPKYEVSADKKNADYQIKGLAKAEMVWLASDEDREGEAISWHLAEELNLDSKKTSVLFFMRLLKCHLKAIDPREIDYNLVNAQQARRVLDRLVGYNVSRIVEKIKGTFSRSLCNQYRFV
jgi:DNA topoisomerase-1